MKKLLNQLPIKDILLSLAATVVVTIIFGFYLATVGIPSTAARSEFNKAQLGTDREQKLQHLKNSLNMWYDSETVTQISELIN